MPLVQRFGHGDQAKGFFWTMLLFAGFAFVFFLITFANTRERYIPEKHAEPTLRESMRAMLTNWPWAITLVLNLFYWIGFAMRSQTAVFYLRYNFQRPDLIPTTMLMNLAALPTIALAALLAKAIGKRNTMICGSAVMALGVFLIYVAGTSSVPLFLVGNIVANAGKGFFIGLIYALMADTVDFGEWKTGVRASGFLFAAATVGVKIGLGLGGALSAWTLSASGYVPNGTQTPATLVAIQANYITVPFVIALLNIALLLCYRLDAQHPKIVRELAERRAQFA
jgi:GPH family glycoside/pentoside/hexuronide:cation symporter